jgi:SAM-dependent methyltransferase
MDRDITISDLNIMKGAINYRRWLLDQVKTNLGQRVLEVGAGIGNYTEFMIDRELVACLEIHPEAVSHLRERFTDVPNVQIYQGDIADPGVRALASYECDTAICFNVLEHVEDDVAALINMRNILVEKGTLLLIVPAVPMVMGSVDKSLGHYRRYTRKTLDRVVKRGGFKPEKTYYLNSLGLFGWFLNNRIIRRDEESTSQILFYSRFIVPLLSAVESLVHPPIGLSLVCIARGE